MSYNYHKQANEIVRNLNEYPLTRLYLDMMDKVLTLTHDLLENDAETDGDRQLISIFQESSKIFISRATDWVDNAYKTEFDTTQVRTFESQLRVSLLIFKDIDAIVTSLIDDDEDKDKKKKKAKSAIEKLKDLIPFDFDYIKKIIDQILDIFI